MKWFVSVISIRVFRMGASRGNGNSWEMVTSLLEETNIKSGRKKTSAESFFFSLFDTNENSSKEDELSLLKYLCSEFRAKAVLKSKPIKVKLIPKSSFM